MSYTIKEAQGEQEQAIATALQTRDSEALYQLAAQIKEQGDDEEAERLFVIARGLDREDWAYDEAKDEGLI